MGRADGEARRGTRLLLSGTRCAACIGMLVLAACASSGRAAELILNEYNAVSSTNMLENSGSDTFFGQVLGNGGDWFELVVIRDRLDIRGWQLYQRSNLVGPESRDACHRLGTGRRRRLVQPDSGSGQPGRGRLVD